MHKKSSEYKRWLSHRNAKNLVRRTEKKKSRKRRRSSKNNSYAPNIKSSNNYRSKSISFDAPNIFSIEQNPIETIQFFNDIISFITDKRNFGKRLFINVSNIHALTTDALMYLLALVNNLNENFQHKYKFSGNSPSNPEVRKKFNESGFYKFVRYIGKEMLTHNDDNVQIVSGESYDTNIARTITDFVCNKADISIRKCKFIYESIIELMNNTQKHAYTRDTILFPRWYCYVEYTGNGVVHFTFMDTGVGIPSTVQKKFTEKIDILGLKGDNKYVISTLNGDFRTSTREIHHGKGLPKIRDFCNLGVMRDLHIVTNKADVKVGQLDFDGNDMPIQLKGTLYNWKIDLNMLKGA